MDAAPSPEVTRVTHSYAPDAAPSLSRTMAEITGTMAEIAEGCTPDAAPAETDTTDPTESDSAPSEQAVVPSIVELEIPPALLHEINELRHRISAHFAYQMAELRAWRNNEEGVINERIARYKQRVSRQRANISEAYKAKSNALREQATRSFEHEVELKKKNHKRKYEEAHAFITAYSPYYDAKKGKKAKEDEEETSTEDDNPTSTLCAICKVAPREVVFNRCGHYCACKECAQKTRRANCIKFICPICQTKNNSWLRVYES